MAVGIDGGNALVAAVEFSMSSLTVHIDFGDQVAVGVVLAAFVDLDAVLAGDGVDHATQAVVFLAHGVAVGVDGGDAVIATVVLSMSSLTLHSHY